MTHEHENHEVPVDLTPVADALDHLAAADAAAARPGLEARIADRTPLGRLRLVGDGAPARAWHASPVFRIAAAVALVACVGVGYFVARPTAPAELPPTLAEADALEGGLALLNAAAPYEGIESLLAEADRLDAILNADFLDPEALLNAGSL